MTLGVGFLTIKVLDCLSIGLGRLQTAEVLVGSENSFPKVSSRARETAGWGASRT